MVNVLAFVMLDLSKAFDTTSHDLLIKKLPMYGLNVHVVYWFKSYLTDRSH